MIVRLDRHEGLLDLNGPLGMKIARLISYTDMDVEVLGGGPWSDRIVVVIDVKPRPTTVAKPKLKKKRRWKS